MADAYENAEGELVDRMMAAMDAAQNEGGDIRGSQSAVIKVASAAPVDKPWEGHLCDFRVYDSPEPLRELRLLVDKQRLHHRVYQSAMPLFSPDVADEQIALSIEQFNEAIREVPNEDSRLQYKYQYGTTLLGKVLNTDHEAAALDILREVFAAAPIWREVIKRTVSVHPDQFNAEVLERIATL